MKRQLTRPAPQIARTASSAAPITLRWNSGKRSQVIAVSQVSEITPIATNVSRR